MDSRFAGRWTGTLKDSNLKGLKTQKPYRTELELKDAEIGEVLGRSIYHVESGLCCGMLTLREEITPEQIVVRDSIISGKHRRYCRNGSMTLTDIDGNLRVHWIDRSDADYFADGILARVGGVTRTGQSRRTRALNTR